MEEKSSLDCEQQKYEIIYTIDSLLGYRQLTKCFFWSQIGFVLEGFCARGFCPRVFSTGFSPGGFVLGGFLMGVLS